MNHVDPETLAAWADGTLSFDEAIAVESHLADCPRCRAVSAAFARTIEPAATAAAVTAPAPSASSVTKWVLPFAATIAITAGVAWQLWPRAEKAEEPVQRAAAETSAQPAAVPPAVEPLPPVMAPAVTAAGSAGNAKATAKKPNVELKPKGLPNAVAVPPAPMPIAAPPPAAIPAPPPPPMPQPPIGQMQSATRMTATAGAAAESVSADRWKVIDFVSQANVPFANVGGGAGRGGSVRASIASGSGQVRWRASGPNTVERSRDGGVTWVSVEIEAPAVVLTAGAAPSPSVCWLVGRSGAVLLSTNGGPFKRVAFPEAADLVSVVAVSDLQATVTAADGRGFVTSDGGKTWRARF